MASEPPIDHRRHARGTPQCGQQIDYLTALGRGLISHDDTLPAVDLRVDQREQLFAVVVVVLVGIEISRERLHQ